MNYLHMMTARRRWQGMVVAIVLAFAPFSAGAINPPPNTTYPQDTTLYMSGPGITLKILAGSASNALTVTPTTFTVTVAASDSFTVRYPAPNPGTLMNNGGLPDCHLVSGNNEATVMGATVTFTPNTTLCSSGGGGGGGGGGANPPSISLFQPNGSETLTAGTTYQIIWSFGGTGIVSSRVSLSTDGGFSYSMLATDVPDGSYVWNIPSNLQTSHARIKVEGLDSSGTAVASAASSNDFTVVMLSTGASGGGGGVGGGGAVMPSQPATTSIEGADTSSSGRGAMTRAEADALVPAAYQVDTLVKLADDDDPRTQADTTVYYIGLDAKRHPFINAAAYFSWETDFSQVQTIDGPTLASIPLGAPVLVRPGTFWVKIVSDPRTYYVEPGYKLRWIKDEAAAEKLGGPDWNKNIVDVDSGFFALYSPGADIDTTYLATSWPAGTLIDSSLNLQDDRHVLGLRYYVSGGKKRALVPDSAFDANRFQRRFAWNHASDLGSTQTLGSLPAGSDITGQEDALFSLLH